MTLPIPPIGRSLDDIATAGQDWRMGRFPNLMPRRVQEILLVSSPYDAFALEEDGLLTEMIFFEYYDLGLTNAPRVTTVSSGEEALAALGERAFDLVITMPRLADMDFRKFAAAMRAEHPGLPLILLVASETELSRLDPRHTELDVDNVYLWNGDAKLFVAIIKRYEDIWNVEHDTAIGGVGVIILIEDSARFRSTLLTIMYHELVEHLRKVMLDGINRVHRVLRLKARPKILVGETYEQGVEFFEKYHEYMFGVITDVNFARNGRSDEHAGIDFIRHVKERYPDVPALLQSSDPANKTLAESVQADFLYKRSPTLHYDVRRFMLTNFGFGDFVFRMPGGREVARAADLPTMIRALETVPAESLLNHAMRNHFSNWLRARTEFVLARRLRPRSVADFKDDNALRRYLIMAFEEALRQNRRGTVEEFARARFDAGVRFARIGGGSLGGKARGLAFVNALLAQSPIERGFDGVRVYVPRCVVIGTDIWEQFVDANDLRRLALEPPDDATIRAAFLAANLPRSLLEDLRAYLAKVNYPVAVRSSSVLEDSLYHPFAGVYATLMVPNNEPDIEQRLARLCDAIKLVYASVYTESARRYLAATPHHVEDEKMAVILQQVVGNRHEDVFYPCFAGVVRSYNFYPFGEHMKPEDGVAEVALGLGEEVVGGDAALRFCPRYPHVLPQLADGDAFIDQSQRHLYALDLRRDGGEQTSQSGLLRRLELDDAERHGTLASVGSVWSDDSQCFYDGIYRAGVRVVTFAHLLKSGVFPLAPLLCKALELGRRGMGGPVEVEFAGNLLSEPKELALLQLRPFGISGHQETVELDGLPDARRLCYSPAALGNGVYRAIHDVVYVLPERFDSGKTVEIAREIAKLNEQMVSEGRASLLIGPGRWGSSNPWLGIPVNWPQINSAKIIIEAAIDGFCPDPSQGSHFFHNLTSLGSAYLTVNAAVERGFVDFDWLDAQPGEEVCPFVRHVRLSRPLEAYVDGRTSQAAVYRPE